MDHHNLASHRRRPPPVNAAADPGLEIAKAAVLRTKAMMAGAGAMRALGIPFSPQAAVAAERYGANLLRPLSERIASVVAHGSSSTSTSGTKRGARSGTTEARVQAWREAKRQEQIDSAVKPATARGDNTTARHPDGRTWEQAR